MHAERFPPQRRASEPWLRRRIDPGQGATEIFAMPRRLTEPPGGGGDKRHAGREFASRPASVGRKSAADQQSKARKRTSSAGQTFRGVVSDLELITYLPDDGLHIHIRCRRGMREPADQELARQSRGRTRTEYWRPSSVGSRTMAALHSPARARRVSAQRISIDLASRLATPGALCGTGVVSRR
jgi:hypothetical protein